MVRTEPLGWPPVPDRVWDQIRAEFGLFTVDQFEVHFETLFDDPEPFLQQAVRVFAGDETFLTGFQLHDFQLHNTGLHPVVLALYNQALEQEIPHNVFSAWMMTPPYKGTERPVDALDGPSILPILEGALDNFAHGRPWVPAWASVPLSDRRSAVRE